MTFPFPYVPPKGAIQQLVTVTGGTLIGNMTFAGGLAAAFDGNLSQASTVAAGSNNGVSSNAGYQFPTAHVWTGFKIWGCTTFGYWETTDGAITISCYAKNSAPASTTDGTLLGSVSFSDDTTSNPQQNLAMVNSTAYTYIWMTIPANPNAARGNSFGEIQFYETV